MFRFPAPPLRGELAKFGLVFAQSPKALRAALPEAIEDADNELTPMARLVLERALQHWHELEEHMRWCDRQVGQHVRSSPPARRAATITGIGESGASAVVSAVGDCLRVCNDR